MNEPGTLYGLLAEFDDAESLVRATHRAHEEGYRRMDAYSPFPIEELHEALGVHSTRLPWLVFIGGLIGAATGYLIQYYPLVISYPLNVGGKPDHSWPAFIPVTFEMTILVASLTAVLGMLALNGLPQPYHPCFNVEAFAHATRDRFYLAIQADDPKFDLASTKDFLRSLEPHEVYEVPH